jgi:uncharacterized integral membrane protein
MALMMVLFLNIFAILIFFNVDDKYLTFSDGTLKWQKYLWVTIFLLPFYFGLKRIFKKEEILKIEMDKPTMIKWYIIIVGYIIVSVLFLIWAIKNK